MGQIWPSACFHKSSFTGTTATPIHLCTVHGCFHATAAEWTSYDRHHIASKNIYNLGLDREILSPFDPNHCATLLSDDSLIIKEGKNLWPLRDTQPSHFQWWRICWHVHTHFPMLIPSSVTWNLRVLVLEVALRASIWLSPITEETLWDSERLMIYPVSQS